jgi:lysophospholipase L1-like esterase
VRRSAEVSRPAWINLITGTGPDRKSPIEIVATAASTFSRSPYAEAAGLRGGRFERWTDGVGAMRADRVAFAEYWREHNDRVLADPDGGPLWVVLGDSTGQGLGAPLPDAGYVGQALRHLRERTGEAWRVLNLSVSGALIRDAIAGQLPRVPAHAALVTCGIGANDILFSGPSKLFSDLRALLAGVPDGTVMLDLPTARGMWGPVGLCSMPYIIRINRVIREVATDRQLPVAAVSAEFRPPWLGKFSVDSFHPSQDGYRDWTRALLSAIPAAVPAG